MGGKRMHGRNPSSYKILRTCNPADHPFFAVKLPSAVTACTSCVGERKMATGLPRSLPGAHGSLVSAPRLVDMPKLLLESWVQGALMLSMNNFISITDLMKQTTLS